MARYRTIDIRIWMDAKFMSLDEGSQLLFIYLLTCPQINQIGTIPMSPNVLAAYLNKPIETVSERLKNLSDMGLIRVDNGNLIWICNFLKYNAPMNPNCAKGLLAFFDEIPDCPLVDEVAESVVKACELKGSDYLDAVFPALKKYLDRKEKRNHSETVPKPYRNQEQEQEQEQEYMNLSDERFSSDSPALALDGESDAPKRAPGIPMQKIVETYNAKLGSTLGVCRQLNAQRKGNLRQRWKDIAEIVESDKPQDVLQGFSDYYAKVSRSDFLMGRKKDCTFKASFDWIHNSSNFLKIFEGNYENGRKQA